MKNILKSEKGFMTAYVTVAVTTFTIILIAIFSSAVSIRKNQIKTLIKIKEVYEQDNSKEEEVYQAIMDKIRTKVTVTVSATEVFLNQNTQATIKYDDITYVNTNKCKYVYNTSANALGTNISSYTGGQVSNGSTINLSATATGTYYLHVLTTFKSGKAIETISSPISIISNDSIIYSTANTTSNKYYTFTAEATGTYKLQVWGAQGGYRSNSTYGGLGGYSTGIISLDKGTKLYVYVGGKGGNSSTSTGSVKAGGYNGRRL